MIVNMHEFVAEHAAQFASVEDAQDALRAADRRVTFVASGGEGVGAFGGRDVDAGHRFAGFGGELADDLIDLRRFLFADFLSAHGCDGELVGEPVRSECGRQSDDDVDTEAVAAGTGAQPDEHDDRPHQREEQRCFQAVAMAVYTHFGIHGFSLKCHPE